MKATQWEHCSATFSACRQYRYTLTRTWDASKPTAVFCGLNPSTADETVEDPTIRREIAYARDWGFGTLVKVNAYAFRSTDPKGLVKDTRNPVGDGNLAAILGAARCSDLFIAAWGVHVGLGGSAWQGTLLWHLRGAGVKVHALKLTKGGFPAHPLYLPKTLKPFVWEAAS